MKSIYEEALEIIERNTFELGKGLDVLGANDRTIIEHALEKAKKQEKLFEELKDIFNRHSLRLDNMREWFNLQTLESRVLNDIEKLIKGVEE